MSSGNSLKTVPHNRKTLKIFDLHRIGSNLPYIIFPRFDLKILVDTGSSRSYISPKTAHQHFAKKLEPHEGIVRTAHGFSKFTHKTLVPCGELFNQRHLKLPFTLFDFHDHFDLLIGLDNLQTLKALVDLNQNLLRTPFINIPLYFGTKKSNLLNNLQTTQYLVEPRSIQQIQIPIANLENGEAIIQNLKLPGLDIPNCLVEVKNSKAYVHVTNAQEEPVQMILDSPVTVEEVDGLYFHDEAPPETIKRPPSKHWVDYSRFRLSHLNPEELGEIKKLIKEYADLFQDPDEPLSSTTNVKHHIRTSDEIPIFVKPYRYPHVYKNEVQSQIDKLLNQKIIRPSNSPYNAPLWIVPKKIDASNKQKFRLVIDFRKLNEVTIDDRFPLPNINELLDRLGRCKYFSTLDLHSGFHQIELDEESIPKTAFSSDNNHYEFVRMPFGLKNAPATFQRLMNTVLRGLNGELALVYLDDILVFSVSLQEHLDRLRRVFDRLRAANLKIQVDKTEFLKQELLYLGHIITPEGVRPNPDKIRAIKEYPMPKTKSEIKRFLGLIGYYRRFIKNFAALTKPMTAALKSDPKITPNSPQFKESFEICRTLLCNDPILQYPDMNKEFFLTTDCSNVAAGAVLSQNFQGNDLPIAYASKTLTETERRYSTIEKELYAIVFALKTFRPYLYGRKFTIFTDHRPLQWLFRLKDPNSRLYRWRLKISDFNFTIIYKPGKSNVVADAMSRIELNALEDDSPQDSSTASVYLWPALSPDDRIDIDQIISEALSPSTPMGDQNPIEHIIQQPMDPEAERAAIDEIISSYRHSRETNAAPESLAVNPDANSSTHTEPNNQFSIKSKKEAVNHGQNQIIFKVVKNVARKAKSEKLLGNRNRITCEISESDFESEVINFVKEYVRPKIKYSIHILNDPSDQYFNKFSSVMLSTFKESQILMDHCTEFLIDLQDKQEINETIKTYHIGKTNHRGIEETYQHLKRRYFWPNQKATIRNFINQCEICLKTKYDRNPIKLQFNLTPTPFRPFHTLHVDKISLEKSKFLSILDPFSKFAQLYKVNSNNSVEVVNALIQFFSAHGTPEKIISDNGAEFNSALVKELLQLHKIEPHFISSQHPESNGAIERFHSTLIEHLRLLNLREEFKKEPTETKVKYALLAYNSSIHSATGLTPHEIVYGHISEDNLLRLDLEKKLLTDYISSHRKKMVTLYETLQQSLSTSKERIITTRNQNREIPPEIPTTVFVKNRQLQSKTKAKYNAETVETVDPSKGTLNIIPRHHNTQTKVHLSNIKRPRKTSQTEPLSDSSSSYSPSEVSSTEQIIRAEAMQKFSKLKRPRKPPSQTSSELSGRPKKKLPRKALPCPCDAHPGPSTSGNLSPNTVQLPLPDDNSELSSL